MKFTFITLFENLVKPYFCDSILKRAISNKFIEIDFINPRNFTNDKHNKVDDYMIGGGAGLLMFPQPLDESIKFVKEKDKNTHVIFLTPAGKKFSQNDAKKIIFVLFVVDTKDLMRGLSSYGRTKFFA